MPIANHLFRREAVYYWRCRLPLPIGRIIGRTHLARSLRTKEPDTARRLARRFSTVVDELAGRLKGAAMSGKRMPTEADLGRILDDIFTEILEAGEQNRAARPYGYSPWTIDGDASPEEQEQQEAETDPDIGWNWRFHLRHNKLDVILPVVERHLDELNLSKPEDTPEWRVFLRKAMATFGTALDIESEREQGIYRSVQHPFAVMGGGGLSILGMDAARQKVSEMFDEHIKTKNAEGKWKPGSDSENAVRMALRLFLACKGDLPFAQVLAPDAWDFRIWLCGLPALVGKSIYTGLDYNEQIALRQTVETALKETNDKAASIKIKGRSMTRPEAEARAETLSKTTVNKHLIYLHDAFGERIKRSGYPLPNPFSGVLFSDAELSEQKKDRILWSDADLTALFHLPVWTGSLHATNRRKPGPYLPDDGKFWMPLIALFTGARENEIASLGIGDIYQDTEAECWVFHFSKGKRKGKTRAADDRKIPVHPVLVDIGLLDYRDSVASSGATSLFPDLQDMSRRPGQVFGRWFTAYCQNTGIYQKSRDFHALRHTFKTRLVRQLKAHPLMVNEVMGHAQPDEMDVVYFHGFEPKDTAETLRALSYKDLDLSHLLKINQPSRRYMGATSWQEEDQQANDAPEPARQRGGSRRP